MDTVAHIRTCISTWSGEGEDRCLQSLRNAHIHHMEPECLNTLTTGYHTLLSSVLTVWSPQHSLSVQTFVDFVRRVLNDIPSSSSGPSTAFGEHLVDIIWTVDAQLDEILVDARTSLSAISDLDQSSSSSAIVSQLSTIKKAKQAAEGDKEKLQVLVKKLLECGVISPTSCRERLDSAILVNVGLIPEKTLFDKKEIRVRTGLFYKQNKFNLLREQSEGYSKLTTEITSSLGPPHSPQTGLPTEPPAVIENRARPVWEKVISLIGYFDLDPNRALDIILDILSTHLATHYSFFLALLSCSPWAVHRRPPSQSENDVMNVDQKPMSYHGMSLDEVLASKEKSQVLADGKNRDGSRVLAQVLGFKFGYYQGIGCNEPTPRSLYLTTALLIREGFIELEDIYPHLSLPDNEMDAEQKEYQANVQARISGAKMTLLAMAAPLESTQSQSKAKAPAPQEAKKPDLKEPCQKTGLLKALLAVGAIRPALSILTKFPWLVNAHPELADLIIQMLKFSISPLYEASLAKERTSGFTQPRARFGTAGVVQPGPRKPTLTLNAPAPPGTSSIDFVFFYPHWADQVPVLTSLEDIESVIEPLMRFIGPHVSRDPIFITKLARLGRLHLGSTVPIDPETKKVLGDPDPQNPIRLFWFKVLRLYLLPALPLIRGNAVCTVEVWNVIRTYETTVRWQLYGEWKSMYKSHPELKVREVQADRESKDILRRLSLNTIDSLSGAVGKLAHSNPCIFFSNAVNQVMAYDNLAAVVVQALKYVTTMGFDVLVFVILDALANPRKARVKDDGVNISDWLQSLASFTGMLFRRYSADLTPVLKYVVHQLYSGQTSEITVLRELIWKMAGIEPLPTLSDAQVLAMAGGPTLRIQAIAAETRGAQADPSDINLRGPYRLGRALVDSSLALPLLVQVAQQRQACVFNVPDAPLKSLAGLFDATHGVLLQYLDLLTSPTVIPPEDYANKVLPPLEDLAEKYGIGAPICMQIIRPVLHSKLVKKAVELDAQERLANEEAEKRLKAALTAKREPSATVSRVASPAVGTPGNTESTPVPPAEASTEPSPMEVDSSAEANPAPESPWVPELEELFDAIRKVAPGNAADVVGPGFYLTFWQLSTYDLAPPKRYEDESNALRTASREEDHKYTLADRSADRAKRATAIQHRARRDRYNSFITLLSQEFREQTISRQFTIKRLAKEKQAWFSHSPKSAILINAFIEHCIQPRCLLSPMDADFCAQFIRVMHLQGTPGFHTLMCYDKLLGDHVKVVIFSCTDYEARNYGRFLLGILSDLHKWHTDEQAYTQDNRVKVAGKTVYLPGLQRALTTKAPAPDTILTWPNFQQVLRKWHRKIAKCFTDCIQTGEFMHVYNAIIVLKEILPVFPLADVMTVGAEIESVIDKLVETEDRSDLKILARAYAAGLKKREHLWAVPNKPAIKVNGASLAPSATGSPAPEKPRGSQPPSTQSAVSEESRRGTPLPPSAPSGPRAQTVTPAPGPRSSTSQSAKQAMDSIPRPEVVKRVRPDNRHTDSPRPPAEPTPTPAPSSEAHPIPVMISSSRSGELRRGEADSSSTNRYDSRDGRSQPVHGLPNNPLKEILEPAIQRRIDEASNKGRRDELPSGGGMPPPTNPSQTPSAQELRETARQSIQHNRGDKVENLRSQLNGGGSGSGGGSGAPSPRVRSPSPAGSNPPTREHSVDSRGSSGRMRSDRMVEGGDRKESGRERGRGGGGESSSREGPSSGSVSASRRDSLTHTRERANRERGSERDRDRDADRGRDRHGDRERDRERDRDHRDRERDRDSHRDRGERDRDRDRDRDRHRRDEKDRDRDRDSRKEGGSGRGSGGGNASASLDGLPSRPEMSSRRQGADDGLGKRRRGADDDSDRASKRSSRKESHRDDRGRRPADKDSGGRDSDRRRKEPSERKNDSRGSSIEKSGDKRDGHRDGQRGSESQRSGEGSGQSRSSETQSQSQNQRPAVLESTSSASVPTLNAPTPKESAPHLLSGAKIRPPGAPLAPRAMGIDARRIAVMRQHQESTSGDNNAASSAGRSGSRPQHSGGGGGGPGGSLRSRISENKEGGVANSPSTLSTSGPLPPAGGRSGFGPDSRQSQQNSSQEINEDRDGSRKRTVSEREKEVDSAAAGPSSAEVANQPLKRPKINRHRYTGQGAALRKIMDQHTGGDSKGQRRHDRE